MSPAYRLEGWFFRMSSRIRHSGYRRWYRLRHALMAPAYEFQEWFFMMSSRIRHSGSRRWYRLRHVLMAPAYKFREWFFRMSIRIRSGYRDHALQLFGLTILCSVLTAGVLLIGANLGRDSEPGGIFHAPVPTPESPPLPAQRGPLVYTNLLGRYAFTYPRTWTIEEEGAETQLASPDGGTVLSFGSGERLPVGNGGEHPGDQGLLRSLRTIVDPSVLDTAWQQVAGHRSFMVSGTADDPVGRSIRFLLIAIPGERATHTISIMVPAHSTPSQMLPRLERIVASFDILDDEASTEEIALSPV